MHLLSCQLVYKKEHTRLPRGSFSRLSTCFLLALPPHSSYFKAFRLCSFECKAFCPPHSGDHPACLPSQVPTESGRGALNNYARMTGTHQDCAWQTYVPLSLPPPLPSRLLRKMDQESLARGQSFTNFRACLCCYVN